MKCVREGMFMYVYIRCVCVHGVCVSVETRCVRERERERGTYMCVRVEIFGIDSTPKRMSVCSPCTSTVCSHYARAQHRTASLY